jgi:hypothetical protein
MVLAAVLVAAAAVSVAVRPAGTDDPAGRPLSPAPERDVRSYESEALGLRMELPAGYYLHEREPGAPGQPHGSLVLVEDTQENRDVLAGLAPLGRETPVGLSVEVHANPAGLPLAAWTDEHTSWMPEPPRLSPASVGGSPALSYDWDGLYRGRSVVVARPGRVYVFSVTWMTEGDRTLAHFGPLLESVAFLDPGPAPPRRRPGPL